MTIGTAISLAGPQFQHGGVGGTVSLLSLGICVCVRWT